MSDKVVPPKRWPIPPRTSPVTPPVAPEPRLVITPRYQPWREPAPPAAATSTVQSVKLRDDMVVRLRRLAEARQRAPHALMKEAIGHYLDREEAREWLRQTEPGVETSERILEAEDRAVHARLHLSAGKAKPLPGAVARRLFADNRIRALREYRGLTVDQLAAEARKLGVRTGAEDIAAIEAGYERPSVHLVWALCRALDVTPDDLMG